MDEKGNGHSKLWFWLIIAAVIALPLIAYMLTGSSPNEYAEAASTVSKATSKPYSHGTASSSKDKYGEGAEYDKNVQDIADAFGEDPDVVNKTLHGMADDINSSSSGISSNTRTFSNKYGSATTRCAHAGCTKTIAPSGDTNCCTIHSKRCLECDCYIDEDATYCMSCIEKVLQ